MCRYVGIVLYEGLVEEVSTFDSASDAVAWVIHRRQACGMEETAGSLTWATAEKLPVKTKDPS